MLRKTGRGDEMSEELSTVAEGVFSTEVQARDDARPADPPGCQPCGAVALAIITVLIVIAATILVLVLSVDDGRQWFQVEPGNHPLAVVVLAVILIVCIAILYCCHEGHKHRPRPKADQLDPAQVALPGSELHVTYTVIACAAGCGGFALTVVAAYVDLCNADNDQFQRWPSTVSELNSDFRTGRGRIFFGSMLMTSVFLLAAKVPYRVDPLRSDALTEWARSVGVPDDKIAKAKDKDELITLIIATMPELELEPEPEPQPQLGVSRPASPSAARGAPPGGALAHEGVAEAEDQQSETAVSPSEKALREKLEKLKDYSDVEGITDDGEKVVGAIVVVVAVITTWILVSRIAAILVTIFAIFVAALQHFSCCSSCLSSCFVVDSTFTQNSLMHARQFTVPLGLMCVAFFPTVNTTTASNPNQEGLQVLKSIHLAAALLLFGAGTALELLRLWSLCPGWPPRKSHTTRSWWRRALMGWFTFVTLCCAAYSIIAEAIMEGSEKNIKTVNQFDIMLSPVGTAFCDMPHALNIGLKREGKLALVTGIHDCKNATKYLEYSPKHDSMSEVHVQQESLLGLAEDGCFVDQRAIQDSNVFWNEKEQIINEEQCKDSWCFFHNTEIMEPDGSRCFATRVVPRKIAICKCVSDTCSFRPQSNDDRLVLFVREVMLAFALLSNYLIIALSAKTEREIKAGKVPLNETEDQKLQDSSCCGCMCEPFRRERSRNICLEVCIDFIWILWLLASGFAMYNLQFKEQETYDKGLLSQFFCTFILGLFPTAPVISYYGKSKKRAAAIPP